MTRNKTMLADEIARGQVPAQVVMAQQRRCVDEVIGAGERHDEDMDAKVLGARPYGIVRRQRAGGAPFRHNFAGSSGFQPRHGRSTASAPPKLNAG